MTRRTTDHPSAPAGRGRGEKCEFADALETDAHTFPEKVLAENSLDENFGRSPVMFVLDYLRTWNALPAEERSAVIRAMGMPCNR